MRPEIILSLSSFFSAWGDRMWSFAVGLYLVKLTPGSLQLAAIYGLVLTLAVVLFGPVIGDWVDRNGRLKVIRITLILQNLLVIICALFILMYLYNITDNPKLLKLLQAAIIALGSLANLAGQGEKIAISKDWVVVVCDKDWDLLTATNALLRRIDLTVAILAPVAVGFLMTVISDTAGIIFICSWNLVSVVAEYSLLLKVYNNVPQLAVKQIDEEDEKKRNGDIQTGNQDDEKIENPDVKLIAPKKKRSNWNLIFRLKTVLSGWGVYHRQNVTLAGVSLSVLFLTVLGFNAITTGYAYSQHLSELYTSICFGAGSLVGILGTFLFPRIRKAIGLPRTGIVGFFMQWSMLMLCLASIWAPGSPSELLNSSSDHNSNRTVLTLRTPDPTRAQSNFNMTTVTPVHSTMNAFNVTTPMLSSHDFTSIALLMSGIVLSRAGLWISDLTITQLQQENVAEMERGVVGGVQYALNSVLDLIQFIVTIFIPKPQEFGYLIIMSVGAVTVSGIIYIIFSIKFLKTSEEDSLFKPTTKYGTLD